MNHFLTWRHAGPPDKALCTRCLAYLSVTDLGRVPCLPVKEFRP